MKVVDPIDAETEQQVIAEVQRYIDSAAKLYQRSFEPVDVVFNIKGRAAGMYRYFYKKPEQSGVNFFSRFNRKKHRQIRFNPWLFAKYPEESWTNTIPHEVAHYIADCCYGLSNIKPHGIEWQTIMRDFNAEPIVKGEYSLEGIPLRKTRRYTYRCDCREVELSSVRHRKVQRGEQQYCCRYCSGTLIFCGDKE